MKNVTRTRRLFGIGLASLACLLCGPAIGNGPGSDIKPRADRILREMSDFLRSVTEYAFRADVAYDSVLDTGQKIQYGGTSNVFVRRQDRARAEYRGDERRTSVVFDGSMITILDLERNLYAQAHVPGTIDAALDHIFDLYGF
ncbi:MAG: DUF2092 domain-containing protein, partial [Planctomycetota bacterium]